MDHFSEAKYIDRNLRVGRPLSRCIQMMNYEYRSKEGKGDGEDERIELERERERERKSRGDIWEGGLWIGRWLQGGRKIIRVTPGAKSEFTNEMCRGAATPMRPVGPSLDFDQV